MSKIRALILVIILVLISLLLVRFVLEFSQNENVSLIRTILLLPTEPIASFFKSITVGAFEVSTIVALIFLIIFAYISSKITAAIEYGDEDSTGTELIEVVLRAVEFLLIFRVILSFIGASGQKSLFTGLVYILTDWSGILITPLNLSFGRLDISALLILVLVIVLDINTEIILRALKIIKHGGARSADFIKGRKSVMDDIQSGEVNPESVESETPDLGSSEVNTNDQISEVPIQSMPPSLSPNTNIDVKVNPENQTVTIKMPVVEDPATGSSTQQTSKPKLPKTKHIDDKAVPEG